MLSSLMNCWLRSFFDGRRNLDVQTSLAVCRPAKAISIMPTSPLVGKPFARPARKPIPFICSEAQTSRRERCSSSVTSVRSSMRRVALKPLITPSLVKGRMVTLDAMHTRAPSCVRRCSAVEAPTCSRPRTINPPSSRILPICLPTAPRIGGGFWQAETWRVSPWATGASTDHVQSRFE